MNYYTLDQAITLFSDAKISRFFDFPQLADLCSRGLLTPTVFYSKCLGHIDREMYNHQQHQAIKDARTFKGYLTSDALSDLLADYANNPNPASDTPTARLSTATIYETSRAYYAWGDRTQTPTPFNRGDMVELLSSEPPHDALHPPTTYDQKEHDIFTVTPTMLRLPAAEVHRCIDDMKAEHARNNEQLGDNTAKSYLTTIGLLLDLLLNKSKGFDKDGNDLGALYKTVGAITTDITEQGIHGQGKTIVSERFTLSARKLKDARKVK